MVGYGIVECCLPSLSILASPRTLHICACLPVLDTSPLKKCNVSLHLSKPYIIQTS